MNYYKIRGNYDNDNYNVEQVTKSFFQYNKGYFFTENASPIDETILPKYLKKKFGLQNNCFIPYCEEPENIFKKNYDLALRVPLSETCIQVPEELNSYLISNKYFVSPANSLAFGLFECYLRNQDNPSLTKALFKNLTPSNFKYYYKNLFDYIFFDPSGKELYNEYLIEFNKTNFANPYNFQSICDQFSIGIEINKIENQKLSKCFIMTTQPESSIIPIIKLLKYNDYLFILYSPNQNDFDGYDENGKLNKGITRGEFYIDSFFQNSSDFKSQPFIDFIKESFDIHKIILKDTLSKDHVVALSNFSQKDSTFYENFARSDRESLKTLINELQSSCEAADKRVKKIAPQISPRGIEQENFIKKNQNLDFRVPQKEISKNNGLDLFESDYISQAQPVFDLKKKELSNPPGISKTVMGPIEKPNKFQPGNLTQGDPISRGPIPMIKIINPEKSDEKNTQPLNINREEQCQSCLKMAKVSLYHQKCPMCVKCFLTVINQFGGKCTLCNTKVSASEVGRFGDSQRLSCERCNKGLKVSECRILSCNCLLCSKCENESYIARCCMKCSNSLA